MPASAPHGGAVFGLALYYGGNAALSWAGTRLVRRVAPALTGSLRALAALTAFVFLITLTLLVTGEAGLLTPRPVLGAALALAAGSWAVTRKSSPVAPLSDEAEPARDPLWHPLALALLAGSGVVIVGKFIQQGTGYFSDDFGYHALAVVNWLRAHRLADGPPTAMTYYPYGSELLALWFTLPFGHEAWAGLAGLLWSGGSALALWAAARALGTTQTAAALVAAAGLATPELGNFLVHTFAATDLAGAVCLLTAALLAGVAATGQPAVGALAGAAAGLALGCKVSYLPAAGLLGLSLLSFREPRRGFAAAATYAGAAVLAGGWWYAHNYLRTGNPFFPAQLGPFAGPMTKAIQRQTELLPLLLEQGHSPLKWLRLLGKLFEWPFGMAVLALGGYATALTAEFRKAPAVPPLARAVRRRLLLTGGVLLLFFPITPYSAGGGLVGGEIQLYPRYLAPSFLAGLALLAPALEGRSAGFWRAAVVLAWGTAWIGPGLSIVAACAAGGAAAFCAHFRSPKWVGLPAGLALLFFLAVPALDARQQAATLRSLFATGAAEGRPIGAAWRALDALPDGARLTALTNIPYHRSPLYGSRRQLDPVFLAPDGAALPVLHEQFAREGFTEVGFPPFLALDGPAWLERLHAAGVEYVLLSRWNGDGWPAPYEPLRATGAFDSVYDDGYSVIWKLRP